MVTLQQLYMMYCPPDRACLDCPGLEVAEGRALLSSTSIFHNLAFKVKG